LTIIEPNIEFVNIVFNITSGSHSFIKVLGYLIHQSSMTIKLIVIIIL